MSAQDNKIVSSCEIGVKYW